MIPKRVFDELEDYQWDKEHFTFEVTKEDITSKDGRVLSQKQANCLFNYFDFNERKTLNCIQTSTYKEICAFIGEILEEFKKKIKWYKNSQGKGDRGFDDDPYYDYNCPYSESDLC